MSHHDENYHVTLTKSKIVASLFGAMLCTLDHEGQSVNVYYSSGWDHSNSDQTGDNPKARFKVFGLIPESDRYGISGQVVLESTDNEKTFTGTLILVFDEGMD